MKNELNLDHELINEIKSKSKCTKFQNKYSKAFRIEIFLLSKYLSYRQIIHYCQKKHGFSPSIGHIKKLKDDGEIENNKSKRISNTSFVQNIDSADRVDKNRKIKINKSLFRRRVKAYFNRLETFAI